MPSPTVVGTTGSALVLLNVWTGAGKANLAPLFDGKATDPDLQVAHKELVKVGAAILFVGALTILAGQSQQMASGAMAIIGALFILWAIKHYGAGTPPATK